MAGRRDVRGGVVNLDEYDPLNGDGAENVPYVSEEAPRMSVSAALMAAAAAGLVIWAFSLWAAPWLAARITEWWIA